VRRAGQPKRVDELIAEREALIIASVVFSTSSGVDTFDSDSPDIDDDYLAPVLVSLKPKPHRGDSGIALREPDDSWVTASPASNPEIFE